MSKSVSRTVDAPSPRTKLIEEVARAMYFIEHGSEPEDVAIDRYRTLAVVAVETMQRTELAYMRPAPDSDEWRPASIGRFPRGWRLNLPHRWRPVLYSYCTPDPEAL